MELYLLDAAILLLMDHFGKERPALSLMDQFGTEGLKEILPGMKVYWNVRDAYFGQCGIVIEENSSGFSLFPSVLVSFGGFRYHCLREHVGLRVPQRAMILADYSGGDDAAGSVPISAESEEARHPKVQHTIARLLLEKMLGDDMTCEDAINFINHQKKLHPVSGIGLHDLILAWLANFRKLSAMKEAAPALPLRYQTKIARRKPARVAKYSVFEMDSFYRSITRTLYAGMISGKMTYKDACTSARRLLKMWPPADELLRHLLSAWVAYELLRPWIDAWVASHRYLDIKDIPDTDDER